MQYIYLVLHTKNSQFSLHSAYVTVDNTAQANTVFRALFIRFLNERGDKCAPKLHVMIPPGRPTMLHTRRTHLAESDNNATMRRRSLRNHVRFKTGVDLQRCLVIVALVLLTQTQFSHATKSVFCTGMEVTAMEHLARLANCSVIEGAIAIRDVNLERNSTLLPLRKLVEISDYLMLFNVRGLTSLSQLFPRLTVIRGSRLFADRYAMAVIDTDFLDIGLSNLALIERGSVTMFDNLQLCVYTIDWHVLLNRTELRISNETYRTGDEDVYLHNNAPRSLCITKQQCPSACPRRNDWRKLTGRAFHARYERTQHESVSCWNAHTCQKECPKECAYACSSYEVRQDGRWNAKINVSCCNSSCIGGCSGSGADNCTVCKHLWHNGRCVIDCPLGTVRFFHRCIAQQECLRLNRSLHGYERGDDLDDAYYIYEKQCVPRCPPGTLNESGECKPCAGGSCARVCAGSLVVASMADAQALTGCAVVLGNLTIRLGYDSLTIMHPDALSVQKELKTAFRSLRHIKGQLRIMRSHVLTSLDFLSELRVIEGGDAQAHSSSTIQYAFSVVDNENLETFWPFRDNPSPLRIVRGLVLFHINANLCPDKIVAFQKWANVSEIVSLSTNGAARTCRDENAEDSLTLSVDVVSPVAVILTWRRELPPDVIRSEKLENHRFIGYTVYYRDYAFENLTEADYAHTAQSCGLQASVKTWNSQPVGGSTQLKLHNLQPYTHYAFYVHRSAISREWERVSDFVYARTLPTNPSRPRIVTSAEQTVNADGQSLNVHLRWLEPTMPNGVVRFYLVYVEKHELQLEEAVMLRRCPLYATDNQQPSSPREPERDAPLSQNETWGNISLQCDLYEEQNCIVTRSIASELYGDYGSSRLSPVRRTTQMRSETDLAQQLSARYDVFGDTLMEHIIEIHNRQTSNDRANAETMTSQASRQNITIEGMNAIFADLLGLDFQEINSITNETDDLLDVISSVGDVDGMTASVDPLLETLDVPGEFQRLLEDRVLFVHDNLQRLEMTLRDLEIYTKYTIKVFACQNYSKSTKTQLGRDAMLAEFLDLAVPSAPEPSNLTLSDGVSESALKVWTLAAYGDLHLRKVCSKPALLSEDFTTRGLTERDSIDKASIAIVDIQLESYIRIAWNSPARPNGLIKFYEIEVRSAYSPPIVLCHPAEALPGNSSVESLELRLQCGSNQLRLRAVSLWGPGYWTDPILRNVSCSVLPSSHVLTYSLSIVLPLVVIVLTAILVAWKVHNERQRKRMAVTSVNPEYIDSFYVPDEWEVARELVVSVRKLGGGTFGEVFEGVLYKSTRERGRERDGVRVAIKTMRGASLRECFAFLHEASTMKQFTDCFHIVKLMGIVSQGQPVMVLMELMSNGDLKTFLRRHRPNTIDPIGRPPPSFAYLFQVASQIADGMAYLSNKKFVHRDLAARNCLVSEDFVVKIGDFGLTRDIYENDYYRKEQKGLLPIRWMAPESLVDGLFDTRTDIWAYGVVLWEMATLAEQPYQGMTNEDVLRFVREGNTLEQPIGCDDEFYGIMQRCWSRRPADRPNFIELLMLLEPHFEYSFTTVSWYHNSYLKHQF